MTSDEIHFFDKMMKSLPLYQIFKSKLLAAAPETKIQVHPRQISFSASRGFAWVWLPNQKTPKREKACLIVSFILPAPLNSPRVEEIANPKPGRWTHHVIVDSPLQINSELMNWILRARKFAA